MLVACSQPAPPETSTRLRHGPGRAAGEVDQPTVVTPAEPDFTELYPYALDGVSREVPARGRFECPELELVRYRGDVIRYHKPARIYVGFQKKLERMEEIVRDTAIEFYGRAPVRIKHLGTYYCRRIRSWPTYISEHGLGNAIDVEGFDFASVRKRDAPEVPAALRRGFQIRIEKHWNATGATGSVHARFLHTLAQRLVDEDGLFRVMLGPAEPGHHNHFHFDVAPWRIVNIFEVPADSDVADDTGGDDSDEPG